ncbi:hypothetical protein [Kosakonia phage Kc166A]|uniref:Uncharacterized protein n=1 Tax=Kosakonia phage Kc166A TaxID=2801381 RepID=A0AAE7UXF0_9CAUD|nr:hypothetical protein [Kosakonia phage Kc166A]
MGKHEVFDFARALGLIHDGLTEQDVHHRMVVESHRFYHRYYDGGYQKYDLIATLRLDDQMNIVDYNNALAICMNNLKQFQSWS